MFCWGTSGLKFTLGKLLQPSLSSSLEVGMMSNCDVWAFEAAVCFCTNSLKGGLYKGLYRGIL